MASAAIPHRPLILLDLHNKYKTFHDGPAEQCLSRFSEKQKCLTHVAGIQENSWSLLHWFVPDSEHDVIGAGFVNLSTTFYVYCSSDEIQQQLMRDYRISLPMKIFPEKFLYSNILMAVNAIALDRVGRTFEPDERSSWLSVAVECCEALAAEAKEQMQEKLGVQPEERL